MADQGSIERHETQNNNQNLISYVKAGDVENVKVAVNGGNCDVNVEIYHDRDIERLLLTAIKNIEKENDSFFHISQICLIVTSTPKFVIVLIRIQLPEFSKLCGKW